MIGPMTDTTAVPQDLENQPDAAGWQSLRQALERWPFPAPAAFWWRDDDATADGPRLRRLLDLAARFDAPLMLAAIPAGADPSLAAAVFESAGTTVAQHGWSHADRSSEGRKCELSDDAPVAELDHELRTGWQRLSTLFQDRFVAVMVPPWNRADPGAAARLPDLGYRALSSLATADERADPYRIDVHLDVIDWSQRRFRGTSAVLDGAVAALERRVAGRVPPDVPIGLMTHHRDHDDETWAFVARLLSETQAHPNARWIDVRDAAPLRTRPAA